MKSLEIVKDKLYLLEKYPFKMQVTQLEKDILINEEQLLKIEKDLEFLEILKKYYLPKNWNGFQIFTSKEETKFEDLEKVKQWLEDNENE